MHRRALEERNMMLGLNHPDTYTSFHNFALILEKQDKCEVAEAIYRWALEEREKVLGPEHPDTFVSINNLGWTLQRQVRRGGSDASTSFRRNGMSPRARASRHTPCRHLPWLGVSKAEQV